MYFACSFLEYIIFKWGSIMTRIQEIDILRSMAIILIIFAHMDSFTNIPILEKLDGTSAILGLSIFFFISGYLMRLNNKFSTHKDLIFFLKKRAKKIYPLYWVSIVIIVIMNKAGFDVLYSNNIAADKFLLFLNILGFQCFFSESYSLSIWWFIGVIMLYYFLFSIILYYSKSVVDLLAYSFFAIIPILFLKNKLNLINVNVFVFYFIFIAGILSATAKNVESLKMITSSYSIFLFVFLLFPYFGINPNYLADIRHNILFLTILITFTLYKIKSPWQNTLKLPTSVKKIADSSYIIYLYHIPLLTLFEFFVNTLIPPNSINSYLSSYLALFLGLPFTLFSGYYIMRYFNNFHEKLLHKV